MQEGQQNMIAGMLMSLQEQHTFALLRFLAPHEQPQQGGLSSACNES
jgi:hypothetical protein